MKNLKKLVFSAFMCALFCSGTIFSTTAYLLNLTGGEIFVEAKYIRWTRPPGFTLKPAEMVPKLFARTESYKIWPREFETIPAYRLGWIRIRNAKDEIEPVTVRVGASQYHIGRKVISKISSRFGDPRIIKLCERYLENTPADSCFGDMLEKLGAKVKGGQLNVNQGPLSKNFLPAALVITRDPNSKEFIITEVATSTRFGKKGFLKPGGFFYFLRDNWPLSK